jgi:hypothetical protein
VLTEDAFNYWSTLKKTSESLGSIFDPQPAQLRSNILCVTTPSEPVIGYVSGTTSERKRIFISRADLPGSYYSSEYSLCTIDSLKFSTPGWQQFLPNFQNDAKMVIDQFFLDGAATASGYLYSSKLCMDCREKGGVTKRPVFWQ